MMWQMTPKPREGETRQFVRFAWFPVVLCGDRVVWLEKYVQEEYYRLGYSHRGGRAWRREYTAIRRVTVAEAVTERVSYGSTAEAK